MKKQTKKLKTYNGDTFRNLMRAYSKDRMAEEPDYRRQVIESLRKKKQERQTHAHAAPRASSDNAVGSKPDATPQSGDTKQAHRTSK